jgi:hypothetical protein
MADAGAAATGGSVGSGGIGVLDGGVGGSAGGAGGAADGMAGMGGAAGGMAGMGGAGGTGGVAQPVTVTWTFPALIPDAARGLVFPTYIAHLLGKKITHPFPTDLVCADMINSGPAASVTMMVNFAVYAQDATQNVTVPANGQSHVCLVPAFDFGKLYALRDATPGRIEAHVTQGGTVVASAMKDVTIAAVNDIAWTAPGIAMSSMEDLAPVFVTPKATQVDQLQRLAAASSVFGGFGGGAYQRDPYPRNQDIPAGSYVGENVILESSEQLGWRLLSVSGGILDDNVNVYVFTGDQFNAWKSGTGMTATKVWNAQTTGARDTVQLPQGGYVFVVSNDQGGVSRSVSWTRSVTREDVAEDTLRSVFNALKSLSTTYSNIPDTYFSSWQHIRRAEEVISARSANCIDGSLLFASAIELIGMEPVLILKSNHAYMGVRSAPGSSIVWPVETTMVGTDQFPAAFSYAIQHFPMDSSSDPRFRIVDVKTMRGRGVLPLPQ